MSKKKKKEIIFQFRLFYHRHRQWSSHLDEFLSALSNNVDSQTSKLASPRLKLAPLAIIIIISLSHSLVPVSSATKSEISSWHVTESHRASKKSLAIAHHLNDPSPVCQTFTRALLQRASVPQHGWQPIRPLSESQKLVFKLQWKFPHTQHAVCPPASSSQARVSNAKESRNESTSQIYVIYYM